MIALEVIDERIAVWKRVYEGGKLSGVSEYEEFTYEAARLEMIFLESLKKLIRIETHAD